MEEEPRRCRFDDTTSCALATVEIVHAKATICFFMIMIIVVGIIFIIMLIILMFLFVVCIIYEKTLIIKEDIRYLAFISTPMLIRDSYSSLRGGLG